VVDPPPPATGSSGAPEPEPRDEGTARLILTFGAELSIALGATLLVVGWFYRGELTLVTRALGYSAACLWLAAALACSYGLFRSGLERGRRDVAAKEAKSTAAGTDDRENLRRRTWMRVAAAAAVAAVAATLTAVALGFAFVPQGGAAPSGASPGAPDSALGGGPDSQPLVLDVSWTVEEPIRVETATSLPSGPKPVRIVLRVVDPERPDCSGVYHWLLARTDHSDLPARLQARDSCSVRVHVAPQKEYAVRVARLDPPAEGTTNLRVQRLLVVSFGDSVAAGEGNPAAAKPRWADRSHCSRSFVAGPRQAAERISAASSHAFVVFVHLACTGAWIDGVGAPPVCGRHPTILPRDGQLQPSQVEDFTRLVGDQAGEGVVILSVGANDLGFGPIVRFCLRKLRCNKRRLGGFPLDELVALRFADLRRSYGRLAAAVPFTRYPVYVSEYFDPLHDEHGNICRIWTISPREAAWAENSVLRPLNEFIREQASVRHWHLVSGIADSFRPHGYCARKSWVVHIPRGLLNRNPSGPFHPNALGQGDYGSRIFDAIKPYLGAG
jgi:hypothetical protein